MVRGKTGESQVSAERTGENPAGGASALLVGPPHWDANDEAPVGGPGATGREGDTRGPSTLAHLLSHLCPTAGPCASPFR